MLDRYGMFTNPISNIRQLSQLIGMDSVSDICKYHLLCLMTIIEVKVMSGHQVKKVKQKNFVI